MGHLCCAAVGGDSAVHMVNVCAILVILYTEVAGLWHPWALILIPSLMKSCGICIRELYYRLKCQQLGFGLTNTMWWRPVGNASRICHLRTGSTSLLSTIEVRHQYHHKTSASLVCTRPSMYTVSAGKWGGVSH